jgi:hypothetical protein
MELRVIQCQVGQFNLCSNEKSLSFYMGIYEYNKPIEVNGVNAILHYSGEPDEVDYFRDAFNNLENIFTKCFEYSQRIWSTTDYKAQCLLFAKLYQENYDKLNAQLVEKHKIEVQKEIEELQKGLNCDTILPDLSYSINTAIYKKIEGIKKSIEVNEKELIQLKENSEKYSEISNRINKYNSDINEISKYLVP